MLSTIALTTTVVLKTVCSARREYVSKQPKRRRLCHEANLFALSSYKRFAPLALSLQPLVQVLGSCPASGVLWSSTIPPIPRKGMSNNKINVNLLYSCPANTIAGKSTTIYGFKSIKNYDLNINNPGKAMYNSLLQVLKLLTWYTVA